MNSNEDKSEDDGTFRYRKSLLSRQNKWKKKDKTFSKSNESEYSPEQFSRSHDSGLEGKNENSSKVKTNGNKKRGLQKVSHVKSVEIEDISDVERKPKALDVIVDVHCDPQSENNNPGKRSNGKAENFSKFRRSVEIEKDLTIVKSLNAIEEFSGAEEDIEKIFSKQGTSRGKSLENASSPSTEEDGKINDESNMETIDPAKEIKKRARKKWFKDTSVIELPGNQRVSSSVRSPLTRNSGKPIAAPRASKKPSESMFAFENAAFEADQEDVLTIETDYQRSRMEIKMRAINQPHDEESSFFVPAIRRINKETVPTVESSEDSDEELVVEVSKPGSSVTKNSDESQSDSRSNEERGSSIVDRSASSRRRKSKISHATAKNIESREIASSRKTDRSRSRKKTCRNRSRENVIEIEGNSNSSVSLENVRSKDSENCSDVNNSGKSRKTIRRKSKRCSSDETVSTIEGNGSIDDSSKREKKSTGKRHEKVKTDTEEQEFSTQEEFRSRNSNSTTETKTKKKKKRKERDKEIAKFVSIMIHRSDLLETDYATKHPMVKVHIVNMETGEYLKDGNNRDVTYLRPKITRKFDFRENRSMMPVWEEELIFHHDFQALTKTGNEQVVILFEIVDLLTFAEASFNYDKFGHDACWYKIAWAFLKPIGRNNAVHIDKKVRLQLYKARKSTKTSRNKCEVYSWWKSNNRDKYPSSLFVTVTSIEPIKERQQFVQQLPSAMLNELQNESNQPPISGSDAISLPKWYRIAAQSCKIPNEKFFETETSENGFFYIAFSNNGKFLGCVLSDEYDYPIVVYEVENGKIHVRFLGHKTFVYSLSWSNDDKLLLSVSSDQTARLWDVENKLIQHVYMLPHPSYVYCGKFDPTNPFIAATGCYDRVARIWEKHGNSETHELSQELEGHEGFVNSMCFQADSNLITADSVGVIIIWKARKSRKAVFRKEWQAFRTIRIKEIEGVTINTILLHPLGSRLLVHSRDNGLRMLDLATGTVLQRYNGLKNQRIQASACISPCGSLVLCGDEDSSLNVWHLDTGKHLARYTIERNFRAVTSVDYHPYDHVLAFSTFGSPASVRVLRFDKDANGEEVGLKLTEVYGLHSGDSAVSFLHLSSTLKERQKSSNKPRIPLEIHKQESTMSGGSFLCERVAESVNQRDEIEDDDARTRIRKLKERQETLKGKSANRLFRIIEKIDRILSSSSRSPDDLETGLSAVERHANYTNESFKSPCDNYQEIIAEGKASNELRSRKNLFADQTSPSAESSGTRSSRNTEIELQELSVQREKSERDIVFRKKRSKSASASRLVETTEKDADISVESVVNTRESRWLQKGPRDIPKRYQAETTFILDPRDLEKSNSLEKPATSDSASSSQFTGSSGTVSKIDPKSIFPEESRGIVSKRCKKFASSSEQTSSPNSVGTYVVEKADFEENHDTSSVKIPIGKNGQGKEDNTNSVKRGSDGSVQSNATFVIENEVPVPKPRKKKATY